MMKWTLVIRQRHKVAVLLASVMALVLVTVLVERKNITDISASVESIYNDRLVPASDIFDLAEQFYYKRFLLEKYLENGQGNITTLKTELSTHDQQIEALIAKYEKTLLVNDESKGIREVKSNIKLYQSLERSILSLAQSESHQVASDFYEKDAKPVLQATMVHLSKLSDVQTQVGSELLKKSVGIAAMSRMLLSIQIVLSVVIGMMIVALVNTSRMVASDSTNYNMN